MQILAAITDYAAERGVPSAEATIKIAVNEAEAMAACGTQNGHADRIPRCPLSGAKRKTFARVELFRF